ncbi:MAG: PTS sugar transporter subunit IIB [Gemmatimonadota bacterium]|nr:MAG: PTS sugar transporter subunit IIB [Gemmatimonadota bacterium]
MTVVLFRIDERLIHGQVVIGWGTQLRPSRYIVVDDELAASDWEQDLYRLGLPDDAQGEFLTVTACRQRLPALRDDAIPTVILTRNVETMLELARDGGMEGETVNLGGLHHSDGRVERLPYLHLNSAEASQLREIAAEGATVTAQDLPGSRRVDLETLLS